MHSDWSKLVVGLGIANQSAFFSASGSYDTLIFVNDIGSRLDKAKNKFQYLLWASILFLFMMNLMVSKLICLLDFLLILLISSESS